MNNSSHHFNHQILAAMLNTVNSNHNNNTTTTSISLDNDQNSNGFNPMKQIPNSIMAVTVVLVNSFVLILFMLRPKLRKTTSNKILLSLVISDLTTGLIMILHVLTSLHDDTRGLKTLTALNCRIFLDIITSWLQLVTMGNLGLIIFERYITLIFPYKLDKLLNSKRICIAIHLIWLIALVIPCVQISWLYPILRGEPITLGETSRVSYADSVFSAVTISLFVLLPMAIFFFIFVKMFREIRKFPTLNKFNKKKEEKRVLKIFTAMYSLFVMFSLPYFLARLLVDLEHTGHLPRVSRFTYILVYLMKGVPPLVNPFVYVLNKPDFRRELRSRKELLANALDRHTRFSSFNTSRRASNEPSINKFLLTSREMNNNNFDVSPSHSTSSTSQYHTSSRRPSSDPPSQNDRLTSLVVCSKLDLSNPTKSGNVEVYL